jgi:integrase
MKKAITTDLIRSLQRRPPAVVTDVYDTKQPRLVIRARPSGQHSYRVQLGRGRWYTLGPVKSFAHPDKARTLAQAKLGDVAYGKNPQDEKRKARQRTLGEYLDQVYAPWLVEHRKSGQRIVDEIAQAFASFTDVKLDALTAWQVEKWRRDRLAKSIKPATVNRNIGYLKTMLNRACEWGHLSEHPLVKVKPLAEDRIGRLRYLSGDEETRLRQALTNRDEKRRTERQSANRWRLERGYDAWPEHGTYTDRLTPIVLLALNTGFRFGELTGLRWRDVDLVRRMATIVSEHAKSGLARHVPLNVDAAALLRGWRQEDVVAAGYVCPGPDGQRLVDIKSAWMPLLKAAKVTGFRFHDLRHTFASKLVQAGVDLNTVRELLGHADIKMTLRYAHLAPEHKAAAVAKLVVNRGA